MKDLFALSIVALSAALTLAQSPFLIACAVLIAGGIATDAVLTRRDHVHYFRRHPTGVWHCVSCPAMRDRQGRPMPPRKAAS